MILVTGTRVGRHMVPVGWRRDHRGPARTLREWATDHADDLV